VARPMCCSLYASLFRSTCKGPPQTNRTLNNSETESQALDTGQCVTEHCDCGRVCDCADLPPIIPPSLEWQDGNNRTCRHFNADPSLCAIPEGRNASRACCVCGGGYQAAALATCQRIKWNVRGKCSEYREQILEGQTLSTSSPVTSLPHPAPPPPAPPPPPPPPPPSNPVSIFSGNIKLSWVLGLSVTLTDLNDLTKSKVLRSLAAAAGVPVASLSLSGIEKLYSDARRNMSQQRERARQVGAGAGAGAGDYLYSMGKASAWVGALMVRKEGAVGDGKAEGAVMVRGRRKRLLTQVTIDMVVAKSDAESIAQRCTESALNAQLSQEGLPKAIIISRPQGYGNVGCAIRNPPLGGVLYRIKVSALLLSGLFAGWFLCAS